MPLKTLITMTFQLAIIVLIFVVVVTYYREDLRFEYDNKMLEKMVRIEHQLELSQEIYENQTKRMNELDAKLNAINGKCMFYICNLSHDFVLFI